MGWYDSTVGKELTWHVADLGLIPGIQYGFQE